MLSNTQAAIQELCPKKNTHISDWGILSHTECIPTTTEKGRELVDLSYVPIPYYIQII